ncbi:hypothetical protein [Aquibium microcysteis]|uniref:hypothetical protein n=1 Tax=Aquibium microcysteis TaxID=675281 RepID=UPI00165D1C52|nr:hypothetical protein [Aquibium microcysteis]
MGGAGLNGRKLRETITLLLSLASHADAAAGRCFAVRWLVLFFLRRGERAARVSVADALRIDVAAIEDELAAAAGPDDDSPFDAALVAWRYRWCAAMLSAVLASMGGTAWAPGRDAIPRRRACRAVACPVLPGLPLPQVHDTS